MTCVTPEKAAKVTVTETCQRKSLIPARTSDHDMVKQLIEKTQTKAGLSVSVSVSIIDI